MGLGTKWLIGWLADEEEDEEDEEDEEEDQDDEEEDDEDRGDDEDEEDEEDEEAYEAGWLADQKGAKLDLSKKWWICDDFTYKTKLKLDREVGGEGFSELWFFNMYFKRYVKRYFKMYFKK